MNVLNPSVQKAEAGSVSLRPACSTVQVPVKQELQSETHLKNQNENQQSLPQTKSKSFSQKISKNNWLLKPQTW